MFRHRLTALLAPSSVALVGATEREGALGRLLWHNLAAGRLGGGLKDGLYPVNPKYKAVFGERCYPRLSALPEKPELVVIVTPGRTVPALLEEAGKAGIRAAVVLSSGFGEAGESGRRLQAETLAVARRHGLRLLGPNCLGLMRTDTGLDATFSPVPALRGNLALVSQSGAICTAILDWARPAGVGFSSVVSLGAAADVDFGEVLDFLVADPETSAVLMYIEGIRDARRFTSALRAAARVKPVIALKVGRYAGGSKAASSHTGALVGSDEVFDAALRRCGTVRVRTYTQLFAAARMLGAGLRPSGERLAILTNGGGPGVMAADCASENGVPLAMLSAGTVESLDRSLPPQWSRSNPVDIIGDAPPARFETATAAVLDDPAVDALLVMYSPVATTAPGDAARAVLQAKKGRAKPVLAAWLGDLNPNATRETLDAGGIPNFYTPENAVEAFSFLCAYRRNQKELLQAPSALSRATREVKPDLARALAIRDAALAQKRTLLTESEAKELLRAFGLPVPENILAADRDAAVAAARKIGFPVVLKIHSPDVSHKSDVGGVRLGLQDATEVSAAFDGMLRQVATVRPDARVDGVLVQPMLRFERAREVLVGVATDPVFGPVISFGAGGTAVEALHDTAVALPPLNRTLAKELIRRPRIARLLAPYRDVPGVDMEALVRILRGVSDLVCVLPWVKELDLNPVLAHPGGAMIADARIVIDPDRVAPPARYGHMAIHPYPGELEGEITLRDGRRVPVRPMRPDDADLELRFVRNLSERSRYQRFLNQMVDLPPEMLARFTQLDYDRELALVALDPADGEFIAVGRYAPNADGETAEFALTVGDAWQGKGVGRALLERLCACAKDAGYTTLFGHILHANHDMLDLAKALGFVHRGTDGELVTVGRPL